MRPRVVAAIGLLVLSALAAVALAAGIAGPRGVRFVSEVVQLDVEEPGPSIRVDGRYLLRNEGLLPVVFPVRFPLPGDGPVEVEAVEDQGKPVAFAAAHHEIRFEMYLRSGGSAELAVRYRQRLAARRASYIVTTVRDWGRPLEEASFAIALPAGCVLDEASPPVDPRTGRGTVRGFWPDRELSFAWRCGREP